MPGTPKTATEIKRAIALRAAGYSLAAITAKTGISPSTLQRHFAKHAVKRGSVSAEAVEHATQELLQDAGFIDDIKRQVAASIVDDLAHVRQLREAITLSLESLIQDKSLPEHIKARALAAYSTSAKLTQDIARRALNMEKIEPEREELPELHICEMTAADIAAVRETGYSNR